MPATVAYVGSVSGTPQDDAFAELGLRLGWILGPTAKIDAFATATSGTTSGAHVQVGTALHVRF